MLIICTYARYKPFHRTPREIEVRSNRVQPIPNVQRPCPLKSVLSPSSVQHGHQFILFADCKLKIFLKLLQDLLFTKNTFQIK